MNKGTVKAPQNKKSYVIGAGVGLVCLAVVLYLLLATPSRSVEFYCKVHKEEKTRLSKLPGDTYPTGVFNDSLSDAGEIAASLRKLEKVAPEAISSDLDILQKSYQKVKEKPSQAIAASLSTGSADRSVKEWTAENCK